MATPSGVLQQMAEHSADLSNTDLSTQVFTAIFGDGWWNIASAGSGGSGPTVIYDLLMTLNSCCAVAVAWLMILTVLIASVGSAQEGKSIGGRYATAWVPLRFSFAFAAITPVIKGMCAMQVLILACIGVSIDLANKMYDTGLKWIEDRGAFTAIAPPRVENVGQQLAAGSLQSQTLIEYLRQQGGCTGLAPANGSSLLQIDQGSEIVLVYGVPDPLVCSSQNTNALPETAFGGFKIPKSGHASLDAARIAAIRQMADRIQPVAAKLATMNPDFADTQKVLSAGLGYSSTLTAAAAQVTAASSEQAQASLRDFRSVAQSAGWFTLGSYYWTMSTAAQNALDQVSDTSRYFSPDFALLTHNLHYSWEGNVGPNLQRIQQGVTLAALNTTADGTVASASNITISEEDGLGVIGKFFRWAAEPPWWTVAGVAGGPVAGAMSVGIMGGSAINQGLGSAVGGLAGGTAETLSGSDAILRTVQYARWFVNACTNAMLLLEGTKVIASGVNEGANRNIGVAIADLFSGGVATGIKAGLWTLIQDVWWLGMIALGAIWAFSTFVAFVMPAMPFLIWVAAIVGWIVLSLEAVIAAPVWLVGHAMPEGEGFAGQHGRQGYLLVLGILLRPCLLVLSMLICIAIMMATGTLVDKLFLPFMSSMDDMGGLGIVGNIFLFMTLAGMVALLTWKTFDLVTAMPDRILRWMGHGMQQLGNEAAQINAHQVLSETRQAAGALAKTGGVAAGVSNASGDGSGGASANAAADRNDESLRPGDRPAPAAGGGNKSANDGRKRS